VNAQIEKDGGKIFANPRNAAAGTPLDRALRLRAPSVCCAIRS
jgi:NAD-dependent DNA ligase